MFTLNKEATKKSTCAPLRLECYLRTRHNILPRLALALYNQIEQYLFGTISPIHRCTLFNQTKSNKWLFYGLFWEWECVCGGEVVDLRIDKSMLQSKWSHTIRCSGIVFCIASKMVCGLLWLQQYLIVVQESEVISGSIWYGIHTVVSWAVILIAINK